MSKQWSEGYEDATPTKKVDLTLPADQLAKYLNGYREQVLYQLRGVNWLIEQLCVCDHDLDSDIEDDLDFDDVEDFDFEADDTDKDRKDG